MVLQSEYYDYNNAEELFKIAKVGDVIEFDRGIYKHYGLYIGDSKIKVNGESRKMKTGIVHRANPDGKGGISSSSIRISSKGIFGFGGVCIQELRDVLERNKCRINNYLDGEVRVKSPKEIMASVHEALNGKKNRVYNLIANNCEHFTNEMRYGIHKSKQVDDTTMAAAVFGGLAAAIGLSYYMSSDKDKNRKEIQEY